MSTQVKDRLVKFIIWACAIITILFLVLLLVYVISRGLPAINWEFLSTDYKPGLDLNGIAPIIGGSLLLIGLTLLFAVPIGVFAAIYMAEYAKGGRGLTTIRFGVESLAGIPSILYGLFGYTFFVTFLGFKMSLLSGALTLSIMILPLIIRTTEESLRTVPISYREGSLALGANKLSTLFKVVLPSAIPGILAAVILAMGRVMGESAAVYYTAGTVAQVPTGLGESTRSMAVHLYLLAKEGLSQDEAFATATVLVVVIALLNALASFVASALRKRLTGEPVFRRRKKQV
ncbi:Phosphate transport system permease protein pstA [uncultured Clostridium sp.]|nr:Phosphate transport system permease protein pstA [uncultured Clostridium sp.]